MVSLTATENETTWASLTASEIREIGEEDGSVLILPIGSIEQHGDHLPVSTDTLLVEAIALEGANRTKTDLPILVLPSFWSGYSPHHLSFGGTISLDFEHMHSAIEDIAKTGLENGFDAILLLNGHGGNMSLINSAVSIIGTDEDDVEVLGLTYFQLASTFIDEIRESEIGGMAHGGEFETSLMLYLYDELVQKSSIEGTNLDEPYELGGRDLVEGGPLSVYRDFKEYSANGAIGNPSLASVEKGEKIFNNLGDELEQLLRDIYHQNK